MQGFWRVPSAREDQTAEVLTVAFANRPEDRPELAARQPRLARAPANEAVDKSTDARPRP